MSKELNDSLDDLLSGDTLPTPRASKVEYKHIETCPKCKGSGRFITYSGRDGGACRMCKGAGKQTFKQSPEKRADNRARRQERKQAIEDVGIEAFRDEHAGVFAWIVQAICDGNDFAMSLAEGLIKFGGLTERQIEAVERNIARDAARAVQRDKPTTPVDVSRIERAFATARAKAYRPGQKGVMVKPLRMTSGDITIRISCGSQGSQWEGVLFVKSEDGFKLGVIKDGKFQRRRECTDAQERAIIDCCQNPEQAVLAYARAFSACGICGRTLLRDKSIARGIGPICAERFGFNFACEEMAAKTK